MVIAMPPKILPVGAAEVSQVAEANRRSSCSPLPHNSKVENCRASFPLRRAVSSIRLHERNGGKCLPICNNCQ